MSVSERRGKVHRGPPIAGAAKDFGYFFVVGGFVSDFVSGTAPKKLTCVVMVTDGDLPC